MIYKIRLVIVLLAAFLMVRCNGFNEKFDLPKGYVLLSDTECKCYSVSYSLGKGSYIDVVPGAVIELGYNKDFIVAKQHPYVFPNPPHESTVNYFIVPIKNRVNKSPDLNKIGPLTIEEFIRTRKDLEVPDSIKLMKADK